MTLNDLQCLFKVVQVLIQIHVSFSLGADVLPMHRKTRVDDERFLRRLQKAEQNNDVARTELQQAAPLLSRLAHTSATHVYGRNYSPGIVFIAHTRTRQI